MRTSTRVAGLATGLVLTAGSLGIPFTAAASADPAPKPEKTACAKQEKQLEKAEEALAKVTAVFAQQKAEPGKQAGEAQLKKEKKAQEQRVAKAQERLAECEAAQPEAPTTGS